MMNIPEDRALLTYKDLNAYLDNLIEHVSYLEAENAKLNRKLKRAQESELYQSQQTALSQKAKREIELSLIESILDEGHEFEWLASDHEYSTELTDKLWKFMDEKDGINKIKADVIRDYADKWRGYETDTAPQRDIYESMIIDADKIEKGEIE